MKESWTSENNKEKDSGEGKERVGLEILERSITRCQKQRELERAHCNRMGHRAQRG